VPDGTNIPNGVGEGAGPSNLFSSMDTKFGGNRALWIAQFQACFDRWAALTGTSYTRIQWNGNPWDDGAAFGNGGANGAAGLRGDVRISAKNIDGASGTLAYNYYPGFGGDMVLDSSENWGNSTNSYLFLRNTILHEHGHGVGMLHVCPTNGTKLMEPFLNTGFDGPQHDDIRGVTNLYGDPYESNNTAAAAANLGNLAPGGSVNPSGIPAPAVSNAALTAIDVSGDSDFYRLNLTSATTVSINCIPTGLNYDSSPQCGSGNFVNSVAIAGLSASIIASDGSTVIHTNNVAAGTTLNIFNIAVPAGTFYVRVFANSAHSVPQMYNLTVSAANIAAPANDACASAANIALGTTNGTNVASTADGGDSCRGNTNRDVWYSFTAPLHRHPHHQHLRLGPRHRRLRPLRVRRNHRQPTRLQRRQRRPRPLPRRPHLLSHRPRRRRHQLQGPRRRLQRCAGYLHPRPQHAHAQQRRLRQRTPCLRRHLHRRYLPSHLRRHRRLRHLRLIRFHP
jgi:hypothetical protein